MCDLHFMKKEISKGFGLGGRFDRALITHPEPSFQVGTDEYWMEQTLLISMNSVGLSPPNPSVGCMFVKDGVCIASGFTQATGKEHAEKMAFLQLGDHPDLTGVTAYVTLEPCSHFGFQPPCVDLFLNTGIKRIVVAVQDPDPRVNGAALEKLRSNGIEVAIGVLEPEARAFQFPFIANRILKRPVWIGKWAQTQSGDLADANGNSKWITNPESRAYTHWLRQKYDAIVVGAQTFLRDQPALTVRDCAPLHNRNPIRLVFDPKGVVPAKDLESKGFICFVCESELTKLDPEVRPFLKVIEGRPDEANLVKRFQKAVESMKWEKPLQSILVEGGPSLLKLACAESIFDAVHIFTGTRIFDQASDRYRMKWKPDSSWNRVAEHYFSQDYLQEWVKQF